MAGERHGAKLNHLYRGAARSVGTGFAFNTSPKRNVTALDNNNGQKQDLDARRKTTIKIRRSRSNNNKKYSVAGYRIRSYLF